MPTTEIVAKSNKNPKYTGETQPKQVKYNYSAIFVLVGGFLLQMKKKDYYFRVLTSKNFFNQVRNARLEILSLQEQIFRLDSNIGLKGLDYSKPFIDSSFTGNASDNIFRLRQALETYESNLGWYIHLMRDAESVLERLESKERVILRLYYLCANTMEQVARKTNYSRKQATRIRENALANAYEFLDEEAKRALPNAEV